MEIDELKKEIAPNFLEDLQKEQTNLAEGFPICALLIDEAFDRFYSDGVLPGHENYADILNQKPIRVTQKVFVPAKMLALKRRSLISLQDEIQCKIVIKGRNSMGDHVKEEQLRQSRDPKFNHLNKEMFLEISALSTPIECYNRIAYALAEIRKYLISDQNNDVTHEELLEMEIDPEVARYPEDVKREHLDQDGIVEDPLLDLGFKDCILASTLLDKPLESENKSNFISLANKLTKLLDETVFIPNFQYSEDETMVVSSNVDILNSFVASKASPKSMPVSENGSVENLSVCKAVTVSTFMREMCPPNIVQNLGESQKHAARRKKLQDSTITSQMLSKKDSKITIKERNIQKRFKIKQKKSPGISYLKDTKSNKIIKHLISNKSALSRCLKRPKPESIEPKENDNYYKPFTIEYLQRNPSELVFEYTPRDVVISFLENMKNYPVLWEFHDKPFNEEYNKAIEELCQIINVKWSLNIDSLKMRRSINRVLRFYRYSFPFECIEKFTDYFDKCAVFLPSAVITIPHARCSHCFVCYKDDFELKRHLLEEHKYLKCHYKCQYCAEGFEKRGEYDFHTNLPHYVEVFTCEQCNKRCKNRFSYKRHLPSHQKKINKGPRNYICDECGKGFKTSGELRGHKFYHGEKQMKCHLCPKSYFKNTSLMLHLKRHREELDFICEICGRGFLSQPYLNIHMEKHMGIQVACTICGLKLRRRNLLRHLRTVHVACEGTIEETFRAKGHNHKRHTQIQKRTRIFNPCPKRSERCKEKGQRQYECKTCNIPFDRLKFLKDHNKEVHANKNKMPCKLCGSALSQKHNLKRHYREKHKLQEHQVFAIVEKNEDINAVLDMKIEFLQKINEEKNVKKSKNKN